jgi:hypothetical protein
VRVADGLAQAAGHGRDERLRRDVLQPLGLVVNAVPGVADDLHQERLDQPMPADDQQRLALAGRSERGAVVAPILDQAAGGEAPQHPGDGGRSELQARHEVAVLHCRARLGQRVERFQEVLGRDGRLHVAGTLGAQTPGRSAGAAAGGGHGSQK